MSGLDLDELRHLRRARDRMDREYDQPLDVPALARTALMSTAHFSRRFREAYGETPYSYLLTRRIERAAALLRGRLSGRIFLGGHSYGGRQTSMLLASEPDAGSGLLLFSYPLHAPGKA